MKFNINQNTFAVIQKIHAENILEIRNAERILLKALDRVRRAQSRLLADMACHS